MLSPNKSRQVLSDYTRSVLSESNVPKTAVSIRRPKNHVVDTTGSSEMTESSEKGGVIGSKRKTSGELTKGLHKTRKRVRGETMHDAVQDAPEQEFFENELEYNAEEAATADEVQPLSAHEFIFAVHRSPTVFSYGTRARGERKRAANILQALLSRTDGSTPWADVPLPDFHPPCGHIPSHAGSLVSAVDNMPISTYNSIIDSAREVPESDITDLHNALAWRPGEPVPPLRWDPSDCRLTCEYHRPLDTDFGRSPFEPPQNSMVITYMDGAVPFCFTINPLPGQRHLTLTCVLRGLHAVLQHDHVPRYLWGSMDLETKLLVAFTHLVRAPALSEWASEAFPVVEYFRRETSRGKLRIFSRALEELLTRLCAPDIDEPMRLICSDLILVPDSMFMGLQYLGPPNFWQLKTTSRHSVEMDP